MKYGGNDVTIQSEILSHLAESLPDIFRAGNRGPLVSEPRVRFELTACALRKRCYIFCATFSRNY